MKLQFYKILYKIVFILLLFILVCHMKVILKFKIFDSFCVKVIYINVSKMLSVPQNNIYMCVYNINVILHIIHIILW